MINAACSQSPKKSIIDKEAKIDANLIRVRDCVRRILTLEADLLDVSLTWKNFTNILNYVLDLSPRNLRSIRIHTEIFTGEHCIDVLINIARHPDPAGYAEAIGYIAATEELPKKYWIEEPPLAHWGLRDGKPGMFGCLYGEHVINLELARYQTYIENFYSAGMFEFIENAPSDYRTVVLEIGSGYGALGYHLLNITQRKICYIIVDLPLMLVYSGSYISTHLPDAKIFIYDPENPAHKDLDDSIFDNDVVIIPNHRLQLLNKLSRIDFAINNISMAEMTIEQVQGYIDFIKPRLTQFFYFQNYWWANKDYKPPIQNFVGEQFLHAPDLNLYNNFITKFMGDPKDFYRYQTFFFTTSQPVHERLKKTKFKSSLPDMKWGKIDLGSNTFEVRLGTDNYMEISV